MAVLPEADRFALWSEFMQGLSRVHSNQHH